jgi:uncharacterized small protein (DUF1192 family)
MIETATAINTLPSAARQAGFESPSEQLIVLTYAQLQDLIVQAVQPLQERIKILEDEAEALKAFQKAYYERFSGDILDHGQRLKRLEKVDPQPLQRDRGDVLRALIAANGGKMLAKDARQKMHLGKEQFSLLLSKMEEYVGTKPFHQDRRKLVIFIK